MDDLEHIPTLSTADDALRWAEQLVEDCEKARLACNVPANTKVRELQRMERVYLMKHGSALGALGALLRCKMLTPRAYNELSERVRNTLLPTLVASKG